jgi:hypothetical protein
MPRMRLTALGVAAGLPVREPNGAALLLPRVQLRCLLRLPNVLVPRDGIIDTGSPFSWFPEALWSQFRRGTDYEELPFEAGIAVPRGRTAGWNFTFRFVRFLQPIGLHDGSIELVRSNLIAQFADGNPPAFATTNAPAVAVIGLWGGALEGTSVRVETDASTGRLAGAIEW